MKRQQIVVSALQIPLDALAFAGAFFVAREVRELSDFIPGVRIPYQYISQSDLLWFVVFGTILFILIQSLRKAYVYQFEQTLGSKLGALFSSSWTWFLFFIAAVYLGNGYLYSVEIPRLVIFYTVWIGFLFVALERAAIHFGLDYFHDRQLLDQTRIGYSGDVSDTILDSYRKFKHIVLDQFEVGELREAIRNQKLDSVLLGPDIRDADQKEILHLCKIYGASAHLVQLPDILLQKSTVEFIGNFAITQIEFVGMTVWGRILKRAFDIVSSAIAIVLLTPAWIAIAALIWYEDSAGPIIFQNKRVGKDGKPFTLYKFRYMYWKYCVKDAYGVNPEDDAALKFEQELIGSDQNTRSGPIYKITKNDPRKMKIGAIIEKFSIDELPQLFNVFLGSMSLVGPRPHQPREVEKYDEWHRQVLTIKPGITGMGQVYARETSDFDREVQLDTYYIENWSILLDLRLIVGTLRVLFLRNR